MKFRKIGIVFICLASLAAVSFAAAYEYQTGKIIKVETRQSQSSSMSTEPALKAEIKNYRISIQLGGKVYVCQYQAGADSDLTWIEGKEVQARVKGKVLYVKKVNGQEERGSIVSTSPAVNPK